MSPEAVVDRREVASVVEELRMLVAADGADLSLLDVSASGTVTLGLQLEGVDCLECVLPPDLLADMVRDMMRRHLPEVADVVLVDPRLEGAA